MVAPAPPRPAPPSPPVSASIASHGADVKGLAFQGTLLLTLLVALATLVVLVVYVVNGAWDVVRDRPGDFVTSGLSTDAELAGVWQGIRGSVTIAVVTGLLAFPLGIATAVYLEEYASDGPIVRFITLNVRNLAGVPSVVFGLLGLNLFVKALGADLRPTGVVGYGGRVLLLALFAGIAVAGVAVVVLAVRVAVAALAERPLRPGRLVGQVVLALALLGLAGILTAAFLLVAETWSTYDDGGLTGGRTVLAAGVTISALVLPIVIITTIEALRAVPGTIREAGFGVGASRWEVTRSLVLPSATPGILTGAVLSLSRAVGEAAPILLIGASTTFLSYGDQSFVEQLRGGFTALPAVIFGWARLPDKDFEALTAAAIIVILILTFLMNTVAIFLRNRYERRW